MCRCVCFCVHCMCVFVCVCLCVCARAREHVHLHIVCSYITYVRMCIYLQCITTIASFWSQKQARLRVWFWCHQTHTIKATNCSQCHQTQESKCVKPHTASYQWERRTWQGNWKPFSYLNSKPTVEQLSNVRVGQACSWQTFNLVCIILKILLM